MALAVDFLPQNKYSNDYGRFRQEKNEEGTEASFDQIMKALLSVPAKENKEIKEKAQKKRKPKKKRAR